MRSTEPIPRQTETLPDPPVYNSPMDRRIERRSYSWKAWPRSARIAAITVAASILVGATYHWLIHKPERRLRVPFGQLSISSVREGIFHDFVPLRGSVVPRDVIYVDASEGGRVNKVLVEPGDLVTAGQPLIEFGNTNLQLLVIQQESQLNEAISQLQQNEIALEQNKIANERALAEAEYNIVRLTRLSDRQVAMAARGAASIEQKENAMDELNYNKELRRMQADSNARQADLRARLLPSIHDQLNSMESNLPIVRAKLDDLIVRAPVAGRVTDIDLKIGENRGAGQRLAVITPDTGFKISAEIDEFYLSRVRKDQQAAVEVDRKLYPLRITRVYPEVKQGKFKIDLAFSDVVPTGLLPGEAVQGKLSLGADQKATLVPAGPFLEQTGGDWIFVMAPDSDSAHRRHIRVGRRNQDQVEVLGGLRAGEKVITSDYEGFERIETLDITH